ncbi:mechanosensitive ion channel family protein [soil metagenome]
MTLSPRARRLLAATIVAAGWWVPAVLAQDLEPAIGTDPPPDAPAVAAKVEVAPTTDDHAIGARLLRILNATGWYENPGVRVDEGVVFLTGISGTERQREWAGALATNTEGVVAVVNSIETSGALVWDLSPAWAELRQLGARLIRNSPLIAVGLLLLVASWMAAMGAARGSSAILHRRVKNPLLRQVAARAIAVPVFLLGLYLVLKMSGLTRLAVTVLGGTGLIGLIIGFAFRDIAENFLASILLSVQRPFATGDLIEIAGFRGFVQSVNTRSTLLMTVEGNHVQIPNATIYKETITNFTANPNTRFDFTVGIGYEDSISNAQAIALSVLHGHPGVVDDPEPLVLVEALGASTVNLRVYFWVDIARFGQLKVRSAVIRLVKRAFDEANISMPDEAREIVFPSGVPVHMIPQGETPTPHADPPCPDEATTAASSGEGDLGSEAEEVEKQARSSRVPEAGRNLLDS